MKKLICVVLAIALTLLSAAALAGSDAKLTVQGTASINAVPDFATISTNASASAPTPGEAQRIVAGQVEQMTGKLLALGIADDEIVTVDYSLYANYNYDGSEPVLTGYQVNHGLSITCRDIGMVDAVINAITDSGVNTIWNISYDVSNRNELYRQALCDALAIARQKAEQLAAAAGYKTLALESVTEQSWYGDAEINVSRDLQESKAAATGIRTGAVKITACVSATYEAE